MPIAAITYSAHALQRMGERNISQGQVEMTVRHPDRIKQPDASKTIAERVTARGNTIRVIYEERIGPGGRTAHVITVLRIAPR